MYHHIRTYNDPNDQIGNNLSVPESNFKQQIDYLKNNGFITITFADFLSFPTKKLPDKPVILTFDDGYSDSFGAYNLLKENNQLGVFYIITSYFEKSEHLSVKQVKNMAENDMEIGSHTASHPDLTKSSSEKINFEVVESKKILENILGKNVISFCYPSGKHNVKVEETVKNAGYLTATTTDYALSDTSENKMTLSRIRINPSDTLNGFAKKIEILK